MLSLGALDPIMNERLWVGSGRDFEKPGSKFGEEVLNEALAPGLAGSGAWEDEDDVPDFFAKLQASAWRVRRDFEASMLSEREFRVGAAGGRKA